MGCMDLGGEALATLRKMQHEGVDLSPMKLCFLLLSLHVVIHDWLIKDGGSMTLWQITAKIEPKLEHYVRNLRKYMKWVMFLSMIDIPHWIVKEMSFNPKNEFLDFRAPLTLRASDKSGKSGRMLGCSDQLLGRWDARSSIGALWNDDFPS